MNSTHQYCTVLATVLLICGCYHPYPNQGWQTYPGYYPAQPGQMQSPSHLTLPPSNAPLTAPGTEVPASPYDDDFDKDNSGYYGSDDDLVPDPRGNGLDSDFNRP